MMSFLFVDTERVWRGGQDQLYTLLQGLVQRGHEVHLICYPGTLLEERSREIGVQVHAQPIRSEFGLISFARMMRVLVHVRPGILAFNTPKPILLGNLASRFAPVRARIIFRRVNFPLRRNFVTRVKYTWGIDCIIAISQSIRHQLVVGGVPEERIRTIYEGMDLNSYPKIETHTRRNGDPTTIGTVAHLSSEKGITHLISAASLIPDVNARMQFVIVGDGECRSALEDQVRGLGLTNCFRFVGFQNSPAEFLRSFDIFVLPSLSEGLSSAILTAMATSLPVIATSVGGIPELVSDRRNGLLVPPADPVALAKAIEHLSTEPEECRRMGKHGRALVEERFTLQRKISETEELCFFLSS